MPDSTHCIACNYPITYPLYHMEDRPRVALGIPKTQEEALTAPRYPMRFNTCARCGHIFNIGFDYSVIPYTSDSNTMFNQGEGWRNYIEGLITSLDTDHQLTGNTFIEIGCGNGHFLQSIHSLIDNATCIGFEPGVDTEALGDAPFQVLQDYFTAERDLPKYTPDVLICRHVIEHLPNPLDFVTDIAYWCNRHGIFPYFLAEVPRIDKAIAQNRIHDYQYEHVSNFTERSFRMLFERAGYEVLWHKPFYGDEVQTIWVKPIQDPAITAIHEETTRYKTAITHQLTQVQEVLDSLNKEGKSFAFWGGTGRGATFLNSFNINHETYPTVIDSDARKIGKFVPGTGQEIRAPEYLHDHPVDIIVITTEWRAQDIYGEITSKNLPHKAVYVFQEETLKPYTGKAL